MARVIHVKRAQQRYATKPVIDPATGEPKQTPVLRNGQQRTTKRGRPVTMVVTERDLTKPKPPYTCDACYQPIEIGTPYKHVTTKTTYGGIRRNRHESCPTWKPWDLSNSLSARIQQATSDFDVSGVESPEDVTERLSSVADEVRSLAEEKREGAQNIEDGFGHETSMSQELNDIADQLESWADEIENVDVPDLPEPEEEDCPECNATGQVEGEDCPQCGGTGQYTPDDPTDDQMDQWREEVLDACSIVEESPV